MKLALAFFLAATTAWATQPTRQEQETLNRLNGTYRQASGCRGVSLPAQITVEYNDRRNEVTVRLNPDDQVTQTRRGVVEKWYDTVDLTHLNDPAQVSEADGFLGKITIREETRLSTHGAQTELKTYEKHSAFLAPSSYRGTVLRKQGPTVEYIRYAGDRAQPRCFAVYREI